MNNTNDKIFGTMILSIGDMEVWRSSKWLSTTDVFYWKIKTNGRVYGPFESLTAATMHYDFFKAAMAPPPLLVKDNVIKVDFVLKKRKEA